MEKTFSVFLGLKQIPVPSVVGLRCGPCPTLACPI